MNLIGRLSQFRWPWRSQTERRLLREQKKSARSEEWARQRQQLDAYRQLQTRVEVLERRVQVLERRVRTQGEWLDSLAGRVVRLEAQSPPTRSPVMDPPTTDSPSGVEQETTTAKTRQSSRSVRPIISGGPVGRASDFVAQQEDASR